jgi:2-desacetyl-2-hydroxyethyl bacteriochlorophyllide A dehydrogenase
VKAIRFAQFGSPEVLKLEEAPTPVPGPREVLVAVQAASVTPGDTKLRAGQLQKLFPVSFPCIPGRDGAGRIVALGVQADYAKVGDAVCFVADRTRQGSYATHIARDAESVVPLPPGVAFAEGAALMHAATCAWIALVDTAGLQAGQRVLVLGGSGAIGGMAVQIACHLGARVVATCAARNIEYVRALGAEEAFAYDQGAMPSANQAFDLVLDLVGGDAHERSYPLLRKGGKLVWLIAKPFTDRSAQYGVQTLQARIVDSPRVNAIVVGLAAKAAIKPQVSRVMPLSEAAQAHRMVEAGRASRGRIVLDIQAS